MRHALTVILIVIGIVSIPWAAFAQANLSVPDPALTLRRFVGSWEGTVYLTDSAKQVKVNSELKVDTIANGWGTSWRLTANFPTSGWYDEFDIWGYDAGDSLLHMFTITNTGETHDHRGGWTNDYTLLMQYHGKILADSLSEVYTLTFKSPDRFFFRSDVHRGSTPLPRLSGWFQRK